MTRSELRALLVGMGLALSGVWLYVAWRDSGNADEIREARTVYVRVRSEVRRDSVEVVKWATRTKTLRDTLLRDTTITREVERFVFQTDTLRERCLRCTASASALGVAAETLFVKVGKNQRRFHDRLGISFGYGVVKTGNEIRTGPNISASIKVWP